MNCRQARRLIRRRADVDPGLAAHLETCRTCAGLKSREERLRELLAAASVEPRATDLAPAVLDRIRAERARPARTVAGWWAVQPVEVRLLPAAAALTLSLVTASWLAGGLTALAGDPHAAELTTSEAVVLDLVVEGTASGGGP